MSYLFEIVELYLRKQDILWQKVSWCIWLNSCYHKLYFGILLLSVSTSEIIIYFFKFSRSCLGYRKSIRVQQSLHKKWSFPLRISSVNVTKSAVSFHFSKKKTKTSFISIHIIHQVYKFNTQISLTHSRPIFHFIPASFPVSQNSLWNDIR